MPKLDPVQLEFTIGKQVDSDARRVKQAIDGIGESSDKSAATLRQSIQEQKNIIGTIEKDISGLEKKTQKAAPGLIKAGLQKELTAAKKALQEEKAALGELDQKMKSTSSTTAGLTSRKRQLMESLAMMEMQGRRGTAEYENMRKKLAQLTDAVGDATAQARIMAHDYAGLQGVISGASGLAGAFSAGAGMVGVFGAENEKLNKIQTRVQSLMAVTIGLQQVLNVLNKDSAFRLVTVARAKQAWAKATTLLNTRLKISIGLSKALMVSGIGVLIAGITALVLLYNKWRERQDAINKLKKEFRDIEAETAKSIAKEKVEVQSLLKVADNYNASLDTRNKALERLRSIMPGYNGYIDREGRLIDNSTVALKKYLETLMKVERAKNLTSKIQEKTGQRDAMAATGEGLEFGTWDALSALGKGLVNNPTEYFRSPISAVKQSMKDVADEAVTVRKNTIAQADKEIAQLQKELEKLLSDESVFDALFGTSDAQSGDKEYNAAEDLQSRLLELQKRTSQILFEQREDNISKRLEQVNREHRAEIEQVESFQQEVINKYNEANKNKAGFTPLSTAPGDLQNSLTVIDPETARQYEQELAAMAQAYAQKKLAIQQEAVGDSKKIMQELSDSFLDEQEKELKGVSEKYTRIRAELIKYQGAITQQQQAALEASQAREEQMINDKWFLKTSDAFVKLFGDIDKLGTKALENALQTARQIVDQYKDQLPASDLESYVNAINNAERELKERNPFKAMMSSIKEYQNATDEVAKAEALSGAFEGAAMSLEAVNGYVDQVAGALDELGFLSEEQKQTFSQVSGMIKGAGNLAMGIASGNPLQIVQGSIDLITNGIALFDSKSKRIERNIKKYKEDLNDLTRAYKQLDRATQQALGTEVFKAQKDEIKNLKEQISTNYKLIREESKKSNKKRDDNAIESYKDAIQDAKNQIEDIYQEIFETITQTNAKSLADDLATALVGAFKDGEDAAKAFEEVSTSVLQNAVTNALKMQLLEQPIQDALKRLKDKMGSEDSNGVFQYDGLTEDEAEAFKQEIAGIGGIYSEALGDLAYLFEDVQKPNTSLTGSIKGVSEKTASALGGQITAIRISQAQTREMMRQQLLHTAEIATNTRYNRHLEEIRDILKNKSESDPLRAKGL